MEKFPYELLFSIAIHLDSPKDICSFSQVSSLFLTVARDDRIWKQLCYRLYNIKPSINEMKQSFYDLFTKILVPYGRYLGYWKSNKIYVGDLIYVYLDISNEFIIGEKLNVINSASTDDDEEEENDIESFLKPVYNRIKIFTINCKSHEIFCYECNQIHNDLPWKKTFNLNEKYFGLSQEALPINQRSSLITHNHDFNDNPDSSDVFFLKHCSNDLPIVYHPITIPQPLISDNNHPLSRLNGIWVGTYGGHGLELLYLEFCQDFICPETIDGRRNVQNVSNVLIARKITGDRNVPHCQISFAAVYPIEVDSNSPICYEGIGQIAGTYYHDPQFIRTRVTLISENLIKVTWYALYHNSLFKRCIF